MKPHFLITETSLIERKTPPDITDEDFLYRKMNGLPLPRWNETLSLTINFIGSGNTKEITNNQILSEIMDKLETICNENS